MKSSNIFSGILRKIVFLCFLAGSQVAMAGPVFKITAVGGVASYANGNYEDVAYTVAWLDRTISCGGSNVNRIRVLLGKSELDFSESAPFANYTALVNAARESLTVELWQTGSPYVNFSGGFCLVSFNNVQHPALKFNY